MSISNNKYKLSPLVIKFKLFIAVFLFIVAVILWGKLLIFDSNMTNSKVARGEKDKIEFTNNLRKDNKEEQYTKLEDWKDYIGKSIMRNSPFSNKSQNGVEFSYKSHSDSYSSKVEVELRSRFKISGLIKDGQDKLVILRDGNKLYFLKQGDKFNGFIIKGIKDKEVLFSDSRAEYSLRLIKYNQLKI
ncbi:hypothetical protein [Orenia marismortui]|uniref:hypothetical protein n=1 Tax=Orenia marismortui TaxID=46469 RepID=UPI00035D14A7|nr:hypothetical protein [Orenia marismortui]